MHPLLIVLLCIGGLILLLLLLLFFGVAKVRLTCTKKPRVVISILGIRRTVLSDKDPKDTKKELSTCRDPEAALRREMRRQKRLAAKEEKKRRRAAEKAAQKAQKKKAGATRPAPNLKENLDMILAVLKKLYQLTRGKMKVRVKRLVISVGTEDAAKTAMLYGATVASVAAIIEFIERKFTRIRRRPGEMQVRADYVSGKTKAEIDIICSIPLYRALIIGVTMLQTWKRERELAFEKAYTRAELIGKLPETENNEII